MFPVDSDGSDDRLRLFLLGGFRLQDRDRSWALRVCERRLLAYLALARGDHRSGVAGWLWPNVPQVRALGSLRTTLCRIGKVGLPLIQQQAGRLTLAPRVWVDAHALEDWIADTGSGARRAAELPAGGSLRGDLLPEWDDDWVLLHRERLRQLRLHFLESCARLLAEQKRYAEALYVGLEAVHIEPLRESAHRIVIDVHLAEGNLSEAIRQFKQFSALLDDELSVTPSHGLTLRVQEELARAATR